MRSYVPETRHGNVYQGLKNREEKTYEKKNY